ncbi:Anaphase promoting complex subunit 7, partial [Coemansia nantahalensis]
ATCHYMLNEVQKAATLYEMARSLDAALMQEMGVYSGLLAATSRDPHAVYQLGNHLLKTDQARPEGWIAMARYFLARAQTQEALAIVWKAQALAPDCAEAYYAEGEIQMASGCAEEAADVYLKAHELAPSALTYRGIVDAYVQCGKYKEAFLYAKEAAELMPRHALALAAVGGVLSHSAESHDKAVQLLEAALELDPRCTAAIASLASLHVSTQHVPAAIALLEKHLPENESDDMYARYADVLTLASRLPEAAANYSAALSLNPDNERAKTGFDRVDRLMHPNAAAESAPDDEDDIDRASDGQLPPSDIGSHDGDAIDRGAHDFDRSDLGDDIL